jgi:hypothetical protein
MKIKPTFNNTVELDLLRLDFYNSRLKYFFFEVLLEDNVIVFEENEFTLLEFQLYPLSDDKIGINFVCRLDQDNELISLHNQVSLSYWEKLNSDWFDQVRKSKLLSSFTKSEVLIQ